MKVIGVIPRALSLQQTSRKTDRRYMRTAHDLVGVSADKKVRKL